RSAHCESCLCLSRSVCSCEMVQKHVETAVDMQLWCVCVCVCVCLCVCGSDRPTELFLGANNISMKEGSQQRVKIAAIHKNPLHLNPKEHLYDIMLVKVKESVLL